MDNRCLDNAPVNQIAQIPLPDVAAERSQESQELGNMITDSGEFEYNAGDQPSSHLS